MTQGARTTQDVEDLDILIQSRSLKPTKVKLLGRTWTVKCDFTPTQIAEYWVHIDSGRTVEGMKMLFGTKDAQEMATLLSAMPTEMLTSPMRRIYQIAGLLRRPNDNEPEGESAAS